MYRMGPRHQLSHWAPQFLAPALRVEEYAYYVNKLRRNAGL